MRQLDEERLPSRSDRKRADKPVQDLARQLSELTEDACQELPAPDDLKEEIRSAIRTKAHGARKRQIKRLAALLRRREQDAEILRETLSGKAAVHLDQVRVLKCLEALRERICDPDQAKTAVEEAVRLFPVLDQKDLDRLSRAAQAAKGTPDRRAYREIFRRLRRGQEVSGEPAETTGDD